MCFLARLSFSYFRESEAPFELYSVTIDETGQPVIKVIDKEKNLKVGMEDQLIREISVMKLLHHPNIVQLYEVMASKTRIYFVMEYVKGGELFKKVIRGKLKEDFAMKYFQQLISAIDFCHQRGVYHRDLKPENLLLDENGNLKVSDFGLSALAESREKDGLLHTMCGTPAYVAPEVIARRGYDGCKADIWSCGIILFVLLAGYLPFRDLNLMEMYRKIGKAEFKYPNWISPDARKLISKILDPNSNTRISIPKMKENSWFRKNFQSKATRLDERNENMHTNENQLVKDTANNLANPTKLNAFDIINLSAGFDLSGLFGENQKKEFMFTSHHPAKAILSKLDEAVTHLNLKMKKKDAGLVRFEGSREGRKGILSIEAEIFEVAPNFHFVEIRKSNGDTLEYEELMKQDMRPALKDIVWTWQGDEPKPYPRVTGRECTDL